MGDLVGGNAWCDRSQLILTHPLDLDPKSLVVGEDEAEVPNLRNVDPRPVDFVDDAITSREPKPGGPERAADHVF